MKKFQRAVIYILFMLRSCINYKLKMRNKPDYLKSFSRKEKATVYAGFEASVDF